MQLFFGGQDQPVQQGSIKYGGSTSELNIHGIAINIGDRRRTVDDTFFEL